MNIATPASSNFRSVAVVANFTAEPLGESIEFWLQAIDAACEVRFAPYNQIFQQLLDPSSLLLGNQAGMNVVLVRLEEWLHGSGNDGEQSGDRFRLVERNAQDLVAALGSASARSSVPFLVCFCPAGRKVASDKLATDFLAETEKKIAYGVKAQGGGVHVVGSSELAMLYPVAAYEDVRADEVGHVPYTLEFFNALGTIVARRFYLLNHPPHKVIVLDCDNTLWRGVCGEDGVQGVKVDSAARVLQQFLLAQRDAGMLLCLCSKNNEEDVWSVFQQNAGMVLRREHITCSRINWLPKSENLRSLANELKLGLDSFIFLDDSAIECAEVEARCQQVLTLQLPQDAPAMSRFLSHVWAFDHLPVTAEDRQRGGLYRQEAEREAFRGRSMNLDDFLAGLELKLEISPMEKGDLPRVAQLTQRTNQFNFTTIRRSTREIEELCGPQGADCLVVKLRDRFGDYGTVGAMVFTKGPNLLDVDNILLSCRALGRRVEHRMLAHLGAVARDHGAGQVRIHFVPTEKNQPAREFLQAIGAAFDGEDKSPYSWEFAAQSLIDLPNSALTASVGAEPEIAPTEARAVQSQSRLVMRIATQLSDTASISRAVSAGRAIRRRDASTYVAPSTEFEAFLASTWEKALKIDKVGIEDNFFELGGHSLSAMQIAFRIQEEFHIDFSLDTFLQSPVLADQAQRVEEKIIEQADPSQLGSLIDEIESLGT
jgi:FkbH-like protein